jgi:hypothetical protein
MNIAKTKNIACSTKHQRTINFYADGRHDRGAVLSCQSLVNILFIALLVTTNTLYDISNAASQGELGKRSSGSIEISVHVNQTLSAISPEELILNQATSSDLHTFKPFCVMHHGYSENAKVPYELTVADLTMPQQYINSTKISGINFPYNIFLVDKASANNKLLLSPGMSLLKQSTLGSRVQINNDCANSGAYLSIEMTHSFTNTEHIPPSLLLLLVSPN